MIRQRVNRTGDGSHPWTKDSQEEEHYHPENPVWGWEDTDMTEEEKQFAEIVHRKTEQVPRVAEFVLIFLLYEMRVPTKVTDCCILCICEHFMCKK